jgi:hypothetical protein
VIQNQSCISRLIYRIIRIESTAWNAVCQTVWPSVIYKSENNGPGVVSKWLLIWPCQGNNHSSSGAEQYYSHQENGAELVYPVGVCNWHEICQLLVAT